MFERLKSGFGLKAAIIAAALALSPVTASALTVSGGPSVDRSAPAGVSTAAASVAGTTIDVDWFAAPGTGKTFARIYQTFSVDRSFFLKLTSFISTNSLNSNFQFNLLPGEVNKGGFVGLTQVGAPGTISGPLAAGTYTLLVNDASAGSGSATFTVAPVPLPAGLALLLTAMGGLVILRRRTNAAA